MADGGLSMCGDGVLHVDEECDQGAQNDDTVRDACRTNCKRAHCGDGVLDQEEFCDDGDNNGKVDGCSTECKLGCGNAMVDSSEECDDGEANSDDVSDACRLACVAPWCGDGVIDLGLSEECDEGSANNDLLANACRTHCQKPVCGDGIVDLTEGCDDGANNNDTVGTCTSKCRWATCGDGVLDSGEECDNGQENADDAAATCRANCRLPVCGDGVKDTAEACDDGLDNSDTRPGACRNTCIAPTCGDGVKDQGEECDGDTTCDEDCLLLGCGNGRTDPGEECDPPAEGKCDGSCRAIVCGDGMLGVGEACEPSGEAGDPCTATCTFGVCGDGKVEADEQCEPEGDMNCGTKCRRPVCGDGLIEGLELCDGVNDGSYGGCSPDCLSLGPHCGDGVTQDPEECERENAGDDSCNESCRLDENGANTSDAMGGGSSTTAPTASSTNGNNPTTSGTNGNNPTGGGITSNPSTARCGDSIVQTGESCDDGKNDGSYNGCSADCKSKGPHCGDALLQAGNGETCDDGNNNDGSYEGCKANCTLGLRCGDGVVQGEHNEDCDDGNNNDGDGCSNSCSCGASLKMCGGSCVDPSTDEGACGGCAGEEGFACESGQSCTAGLCGDSDWSVVSNLSGSNQESHPLVGMDSNGNAIAVWTQTDSEGIDQIFANYYNKNSGWTAVDDVFKAGTSDANDVRLAVSGNGTAVVAWQDEEGVWASRYSGSWRSRVRLDTGTGKGRDVSVSINESGTAVVSWEDQDEVWAASMGSDGKWTTAQELVSRVAPGEELSVREPSVAMGATRANAVWQHSASGADDSVVLMSSQDGNWSGSSYLNSSADAYSARIACVTADQFVVTWIQGQDLVSRVQNAAGSFGSVATLGIADSGSDVRLASNRQGVVFATWHYQDMVYASRMQGGVWSAAAPLSAAVPRAQDPDVAVGANGLALVVWDQEYNGSTRVWLRKYAGSSWAKAQILPSVQDDHSDARVALSSSGAGMVVWEQDNGLGSSYNTTP